MVRKKQKKKQVRVQRRRRLGLILLHVFLLFAGGCMGNRETVYAKELAGDERTIHGDVTAEDLTFSFASPGMRARAITGQEPDVSLEKSARWTDIEEGYAELTITEQDTAVTSNIPVDYIFILDRTRTMSLNESTFEGSDGSMTYQLSNSPCINPDHYYYKGGISLWLKDYYTGYDYENHVWYENLPGDAEFWNRHYNGSGKKILPSYENGCQDRLSMAKQAAFELVDKVAEENEGISAGGLKSRIAFWSFGDSYKVATGDERELGLYNYTPLTADYDKVKRAISEVKTYSGTYYLESLKEAYRILTTRNATDSARKNVYTKVVFLSDGECTTQVEESLAYADKIKALPNTEIFTLAVGMTADSSGTQLLRKMASSSQHTASFWQNLSFSGGEGSALANSLLQINAKGIEVKAVNKVVTDQIETKYWEPIEVVRASGGKNSVSLDVGTGLLTWYVPEGAGTVNQCTVKLKLRDEYRYLLSDTSYPTNRDAKGADRDVIAADPSKAGAVIRYTISGGAYQGQKRELGAITPKLKYGTVIHEGKKNWTVLGAEGEYVKVQLMRKLPTETQAIPVNQVTLDGTEAWQFSFQAREMADGSMRPLIKYDEEGRKIIYEIKEESMQYYQMVNCTVSETAADENGGIVTNTQLYNEPYKVKAQIQKVDNETGNLLAGAEFTVYSWSREAGEYLPYKGITNVGSQPCETGNLTGSETPMTLVEESQGIYKTPSWLYYSCDNQGKFRIVETKAPKGYWGDWKEGTQSFTDTDKNVYDFQISEEETENKSTIFIANTDQGTFTDERVKGSILFSKKDRDTGTTTAQGDAALEGAEYRLYAAEDIVHQDGTTGLLYKKDEEINVRLVSSAQGINRYTWDSNGSDILTVGSGLQVEVEDLEIGRYYLKEVTAGKGYLVDPAKYEFEIAYKNEQTRVVEIEDYSVYDSVKKQALSFYKVTGGDHTTQMVPLKGAGFSVFLLSDLGEGKYDALTDEEISQAIVDEYRNPETLGYEKLKDEKAAVIYEHGIAIEISELESDENGIVTTPELPYGTYVVVETTVPKGTLAVRPFVLRVLADDQDRFEEGDGKGSKLQDLVILVDRPVMALVRVEKVDSKSKETVLKPGAAYVIHDVDGAWFDYYTEGMTTLQKMTYKVKYGDLVVQYSQGEHLGTRENPLVTRNVSTAADDTSRVYLETPTELPVGIYELEEVLAPEGYVLQGKEGVIAKDAAIKHGNHTFYETEENGWWKQTPQGRTRFAVSSEEAVYDEALRSFVVVAKQQNDPVVGKISIYAEGEQLAGARKPGGLFPDLDEMKAYEFIYEAIPVQGAEFEIRAAEDIFSQEGSTNGKKLFSAGELVTKLTTDENGQAWTGREDWEGTDIAKGLPLGVYTVTQTKAGAGFALSKENAKPREIEILYAGQEVPVVYRDTVYTIPRQQVYVEVKKKDADTKAEASGAVFGLYTKEAIKNWKGETVVEADALVGTAQTEKDGNGKILPAVFQTDLPLAQYEIREICPPAGYVGSGKTISVDASYQADQKEQIEVQAVFENTPIKVQVNLMDYFTEQELDEGKLIILDEENRQLAELKTAHGANAILYGLEAGRNYTVRMTKSPVGYEDQLCIREEYETVKENAFELDKGYPDDSVTDQVVFRVQEQEALQVVSVFAKPVQGRVTIQKIGQEASGTIRETDDAGFVTEKPIYEIHGLPGAEYVLRAKEDIWYPDGYSGILYEKDQIILDCYAEKKDTELFRSYQLTIVDDAGSMEDVSVWKGIKPDKGDTADEIQAFFREHGTRVERQIPSMDERDSGVAAYEGNAVDHVLRTGNDGVVKLAGLPLGEYEIIEVKAPEGYYRNLQTCVQVIAVEAAQDEKDQSVNTAETFAEFYNDRQSVPEYEIPEEKPGTDPDGPQEESYANGFSVVKYSVEDGKRTPMEGAVFTVYAKETVKNIHGITIYEAGQEIESAVSDMNGIAVFDTDLPVGQYVVKETKAPKGHYNTEKELCFRLDAQRSNDSIRYLSFRDFVENAITVVNVKLVDDLTGNELANASLQIKDAAGNAVEAWITNVDGGYVIKGLSTEEEYTITETMPRDGYLTAFTGADISSGNARITEKAETYVKFRLDGRKTGITPEGRLDEATVPEMTKIVVENPFAVGQVQVDKRGEVLDSWGILEYVRTFLKSTFTYREGPLEGVAFTVYAKEDIVHPDGITGVVLKKGEVAAVDVRGTQTTAVKSTDAFGKVCFEGMYLGQYEITETSASEGYILDSKPRVFTLSYVDGKTSPVQAEAGNAAWKNERRQLKLEVTKKDSETGELLQGAVFGLYTGGQIKNDRGDVLTEKDVLLEMVETGIDGKAVFVCDLPKGAYYVKEERSPYGYGMQEETRMDLQEELFTAAETEARTQMVSWTVCNDPKDVKLEVEKSCQETVREGERLLYTIHTVKNAGNCKLEQVVMTDVLPEGIILQSLDTGTFYGSGTERYSVWYQTNRDEAYQLWKDDLHVSVNTQLSVSELLLKEGEEIRSFQYRFGTVNKGFSQLEKPVYEVLVKEGLGVDVLENLIFLRGDKNGTAYEVKDRTKTDVIRLHDAAVEVAPVKTDDAYWDSLTGTVALGLLAAAGAGIGCWKIRGNRKQKRNM